MAASEISAYQSTAYFTQQANSGFEQARTAALQEKPAFLQNDTGIVTRAAVPKTGSPDATPQRAANRNGETRGKYVDILA